MAWIGLIDESEKVVKPMFHAGVEEGYLQTIKISLSEEPESRGPTGEAIRHGAHFISTDTEDNPLMLPWRKEALRRGYRSSGSFPIKREDAVIGALTVYSSESDFFDDKEIALLDDIADNISSALDYLEREHRRGQAEDALIKSEARFQEMAANIREVFWIASADFSQMLYVSPAYENIWGDTDRDNLYKNPHTWIKAVHPDDQRLISRALEDSRGGKASDVEYRIIRPDGSVRWIHDQRFPVHNEEGNVYRVTGIAEDITRRKKVEEQNDCQIKRLAALRNIDKVIISVLDVRVAITSILQQITDRLGIDAAAILLMEPSAHTLRFADGCGFNTSAIKQTYLRIGEGPAGVAALERRTVRVHISREDDCPAQFQPFAREGFVEYIAIPMIAKGKVKGVLELFFRVDTLPDQECIDFQHALATQTAIAIDNSELFQQLTHGNMELTSAYDTTIEALSRAIDLRDEETEGHSQRVTEKTVHLARAAGMTAGDLVHVRRGALLHDIGKLGVPDSILLKPGHLNEEEWKVMKKHPSISYELLSPIAFLKQSLDIPYCHHEKWDGSGYPRGLKNTQIPLAARLFAIVDVWDALTSDRPYRRAWDVQKTREHMLSMAAIQFDSDLLALFFKTFPVPNT